MKLVSVFGAAPAAAAGPAAFEALLEVARRRIPDAAPVAALTWKAEVARRELTRGGQPETSIATLIAALAGMADGVLIELVFVASDGAVATAPRMVPARRNGRLS